MKPSTSAATIASTLFVFILQAAAPVANASQAAGSWYKGTWRCSIDGRKAAMRWSGRNRPEVSDCRFDAKSRERVCTSSSGAEMVGKFKDSNGPWLRLKRVTDGPNTLYMRHPDGNLWFLKSIGQSARGWTTWRGKRYPLNCTRT